MTRALRVCFALLPVLLWGNISPARAQNSARYAGPIIDMHMHAANVQSGPDGQARPLRISGYPGPGEFRPSAAATEAEVLRITLAEMDRHNVVLGFLSGYDGTPDGARSNAQRVQAWLRAAPGRFIPGVFVSRPGDPPIAFVREEFMQGRLKGLGEIAAQYFNFRPNDPALEPYFTLAAEQDIPTHIHTAGIGAPVPTFRPSAGNPLLLEDVLARYPSLRLFVENSGFPFTEDWIAVAYQYPQLYGDVSTATWAVNRTAFYRHLRTLVEAGLGKRIMFGSDQMEWPETISLAIEAIQTADFLTLEQKADIFYNNAARFLRLSQEQIARHHGR